MNEPLPPPPPPSYGGEPPPRRSDPYAPSGAYYDPQGDPEVIERLKTPATIMLVMAILGALAYLGNLTMFLFLPSSPTDIWSDPELQRSLEELGWNAADFQQLIETFSSPAYNIASSFFNIALLGLMAFGSLKMLRGESYTLAMVATVLAIIPCFATCCCLIEMPVGIWALTILLSDDVKRAFT